MKSPQLQLPIHKKLIADLFAGGGGMSVSFEEALGRSPDIAINHNEAALSLHKMNHPQTEHYISDVWEVCPKMATGGLPLGWLHLSPDCTDHTQAKGGQPRSKRIRGLSWVALPWAGQARPDILSLENVKEILKWGPLIAKRDKATGRVVKLDGSVAAPGERVPVQDQHLVPDPKRRGIYWRKLISTLEGMGYKVEYRTITASAYGANTDRLRLFMLARCDGQPIVWPEPTHTKTPSSSADNKYPPAADIIDWSIECPSIFTRPRPLADNTLKRIAVGVHRYVLNSADPFIVPIAHYNGSNPAHSIREPLRTITANPKGGAFALCEPTLVPASAYMMQANGGFNTVVGRDMRDPLSTITTTGSQQQVIAAQLAQLRHRDAANDMRGKFNPHLHTLDYGLNTDEEEGALRVAAFLLRYHGEGGQWGSLTDPATTITTKARLALVTVTIKGNPYVIVDIGLRMLQPHELFAAQGFPSHYIIDRGHDGRRFSKAQQIFFCGNSVSPPPAIALIRANGYHLASRDTLRMAS